MKSIITYCLCCIISISTYSQSTKTDTSKTKLELFPKQHGEKNWKFLLSLDARRSYFDGTKVKINGLRIGTEYKGVHRFGLGFYWLNKNAVFQDITVPVADQDLDSKEVRFNLGYTSLFYERVFLKTRYWEVDFPVHLAGGRVEGFYKDTIGAFKPFTERPFSALIPSTQVKFYPLEWLAIRGSLGYRILFNTGSEVKRTFRTAFYGYGLSVNVLGMYRAVFKKENKKNSTTEQNNQETR
ncbi:MAG: hypothetical protein ABJG68_01135 [Crocinitomicaceae bacterium]